MKEAIIALGVLAAITSTKARAAENLIHQTKISQALQTGGISIPIINIK